MPRDCKLEAFNWPREHRSPGYLARGFELLSEAATKAGDHIAAAEHICDAIAALNGIDIPSVDWQVHATAAEVLGNVGRRQESEVARARAIAVGQRLAATLANEPALQNSLLRQIARRDHQISSRPA